MLFRSNTAESSEEYSESERWFEGLRAKKLSNVIFGQRFFWFIVNIFLCGSLSFIYIFFPEYLYGFNEELLRVFMMGEILMFIC